MSLDFSRIENEVVGKAKGLRGKTIITCGGSSNGVVNGYSENLFVEEGDLNVRFGDFILQYLEGAQNPGEVVNRIFLDLAGNSGRYNDNDLITRINSARLIQKTYLNPFSSEKVY